MEQQLKQLIDESGSVVITSHIGPDGDSISSCLLLYSILKLNYPVKRLYVSMEEESPYLAFVESYKEIRFDKLANTLTELKPALLIILDANSYNRISRQPESVRPLIASMKVAIIDHHEPVGKDESDIYINRNNSSVSQDIYEIFLEELTYKKPAGYAQTTMLGIYTDTGGFIYKSQNYRKTFEVATKLIDDGADLESIVHRLNNVNEPALRVLRELITNLNHIGDCSYSFLSDEFISSCSIPDVREGSDMFRSNYLRNISGRPWGFLVYKDQLDDGQTYSVSFRALSDTVDVSEMAAALGGGGHKPAAGAKFRAESVQAALSKVKAAVEQYRAS